MLKIWEIQKIGFKLFVQKGYNKTNIRNKISRVD